MSSHIDSEVSTRIDWSTRNTNNIVPPRDPDDEGEDEEEEDEEDGDEPAVVREPGED